MPAIDRREGQVRVVVGTSPGLLSPSISGSAEPAERHRQAVVLHRVGTCYSSIFTAVRPSSSLTPSRIPTLTRLHSITHHRQIPDRSPRRRVPPTARPSPV